MKRTDVLIALEAVKPGIASKDIIESMTYFFFSGTHVISYNDKISIQYPFKTNFTLFVKAKDIYNLIKKATVATIDMVEKDGKLYIKSRTLQATLAGINDEEVQSRIKNVDKSLSKAKWQSLPSNFSECMSLCSFAASKTDSDQTLSCINVDGKDCVALDNQRIAHAIMDSPIPENLLVQASEVGNLNSLNPTSYFSSKAWVHFKNDKNCIFSIRKVVGDFPECMEFFDFEGTKVNLPKSVLEGLDITSIIADTVQPSVSVSIKKNVCFISVASESGNIKHKSKIKYDGDEVQFNINPSFLKEMMTYSTSIIVASDRARLENENFSLVTALVLED